MKRRIMKSNELFFESTKVFFYLIIILFLTKLLDYILFYHKYATKCSSNFKFLLNKEVSKHATRNFH